MTRDAGRSGTDDDIACLTDRQGEARQKCDTACKVDMMSMEWSNLSLKNKSGQDPDEDDDVHEAERVASDDEKLDDGDDVTNMMQKVRIGDCEALSQEVGKSPRQFDIVNSKPGRRTKVEGAVMSMKVKKV